MLTTVLIRGKRYRGVDLCVWLRNATVAVVAAVAIINVTGCADNGMAEANATQLQQQQQQITDLQTQIDALKNQQTKFYSISSQIAPGGCDQGVTHDATQRGDEKLAGQDYEAALGYFEDAQSACPNSAETELNLGRVYDAMGERDQAAPHYRRAIELAKDSDPTVASQARTALGRIASDPN